MFLLSSTLQHIVLYFAAKSLSNFNCFVIINVLIGIRLYILFITLHMHGLYIRFQYVAANQHSFHIGNRSRNWFELLSCILAISLLRTLDRNGWEVKLVVNKKLDSGLFYSEFYKKELRKNFIIFFLIEMVKCLK